MNHTLLSQRGERRLSSPDYNQVIIRIRRLWNEGTTEFPVHATDQMEERVVDANDIQHVIRFGKIVEHVPPEENSGLWRFRIRGKDVEGEKLDCVVDIDSIDDDNSIDDGLDPIEGDPGVLVIVTVF